MARIGQGGVRASPAQGRAMIWVALIAGILVCVVIMYAVWRLVRRLEE